MKKEISNFYSRDMKFQKFVIFIKISINYKVSYKFVNKINEE